MSTIDISLGFRHISPQELRNYANLGIISCAGVDLTEFCNKLLEDMHSQEDLDQLVKDDDESYDRGYADGRENVVEETIRYLSNI